MQSSPSRNYVRNSQVHIPGQRLTKETGCLAKETTIYVIRQKARLTKGIYLNWRLTKEIAVRSVSQKAFI